MTEDDNLLVFYAGHGYWEARTQKGYWFPADSKYNNTANWLRNSTISGYISGIKSKNTLLIADACFSGSIFRTRSITTEDERTALQLYDIPCRKAMTSGDLKAVPDESVFLHYLTKKLTENQKKFLTAEELYLTVKPGVANNSDNIPQFGVIKNSGDEGGEFVFVRKQEN